MSWHASLHGLSLDGSSHNDDRFILKSTTESDGNSSKPRMLCLHGYRSNETISKLQLENLGLTSKFNVTYLSAPYISNEAAEDQKQLANIFSEGPFYSWFELGKTADENQNDDKDQDKHILEQMLKSLKSVIIHLDVMQCKRSSAEDPVQPYYDAVYGFSQGATIVTLLSDTKLVKALRDHYATEMRAGLPSSCVREIQIDPDDGVSTSRREGSNFKKNLGKFLADFMKAPVSSNSARSGRTAMDEMDLNASIHHLKKLSTIKGNEKPRRSSITQTYSGSNTSKSQIESRSTIGNSFLDFIKAPIDSNTTRSGRKSMDDLDLSTSMHHWKKISNMEENKFARIQKLQNSGILSQDTGDSMKEMRKSYSQSKKGASSLRSIPSKNSSLRNINKSMDSAPLTSTKRVVIQTMAGADVDEDVWNQRSLWGFCFVACHGKVRFIELVQEKIFGMDLKIDLETGRSITIQRARESTIGSVHYIGINDHLKSESEIAMINYYNKKSAFPIYIDAGHTVSAFRSKIRKELVLLEAFAWYSKFKIDERSKNSLDTKNFRKLSIESDCENRDYHSWLDFNQAHEAHNYAYIHNETSLLYVTADFKKYFKNNNGSNSDNGLNSASNAPFDRSSLLKNKLLSEMKIGNFGQYVMNSNKSTLLTIMDTIKDVDPSKPMFYDIEIDQPVLYGEMCEFILGDGSLRLIGADKNDVVAYVAPPGIASAAAFLTIASQCVAAPIDPSYSAEDFSQYLEQLNPSIIIIFDECSCKNVLSDLAQNHGISIIYAKSDSRGLFKLRRSNSISEFDKLISRQHLKRTYNEVALILRTSGSTSMPKLCPITMDALVSNAMSISQNLTLTPNDVALNALPLFHIGGISSNLLASIVTGASIILMKEFDAKLFFSVLAQREFEAVPKPTWYSAVPTLHSSICDVAANDSDTTSEINLRFIRSGAAALPKDLWERLEVTFKCPVISTYSMTEQMPITQVPVPVKKVRKRISQPNPLTSASQLNLLRDGQLENPRKSSLRLKSHKSLTLDGSMHDLKNAFKSMLPKKDRIANDNNIRASQKDLSDMTRILRNTSSATETTVANSCISSGSGSKLLNASVDENEDINLIQHFPSSEGDITLKSLNNSALPLSSVRYDSGNTPQSDMEDVRNQFPKLKRHASLDEAVKAKEQKLISLDKSEHEMKNKFLSLKSQNGVSGSLALEDIKLQKDNRNESTKDELNMSMGRSDDRSNPKSKFTKNAVGTNSSNKSKRGWGFSSTHVSSLGFDESNDLRSSKSRLNRMRQKNISKSTKDELGMSMGSSNGNISLKSSVSKNALDTSSSNKSKRGWGFSSLHVSSLGFDASNDLRSSKSFLNGMRQKNISKSTKDELDMSMGSSEGKRSLKSRFSKNSLEISSSDKPKKGWGFSSLHISILGVEESDGLRSSKSRLNGNVVADELRSSKSFRKPREALWRQKKETVGQPISSSLCIVDTALRPIQTGATGEVCISASTVIDGYMQDKESNRKSFFFLAGTKWFRTGDLGSLDTKGFLTITGRQKEVIKRGGEQISPFEVEEAIASHYQVKLALVFGIPCPFWGQRVGTAVVLNTAQDKVCTSDIQRNLREYLTDDIQMQAHKIPEKILIVNEESLPKTRSNKYTRIGLAEKLNVKFDNDEVDLLALKPVRIHKAVVGVRFILACWVFFNHVGDFSAGWNYARSFCLHPPAFFFLGGFLLSASTNAPVVDDLKNFYAVRLAVLHPMYVFSVICLLATFVIRCNPQTFQESFDYDKEPEEGNFYVCQASIFEMPWGLTLFTSLFSHLLGLQTWPFSIPFQWFISMYAWFSSVYIFCVIVFPWVHKSFYIQKQNKGKIWEYILRWLIIHYAFVALFSLNWYLESDTATGQIYGICAYLFPPGWLPCFAIGVGAYFVFALYAPNEKLDAWKWGVLTDVLSVLILGMFLFYGLEHDAASPAQTEREWRLWAYFLSRLVAPIGFVWLYGLAVGHGLSARLISNNLFVVHLAPASYNIYLFHQLIYEWYWFLTRGYWWANPKSFFWFSPRPTPLPVWEFFVLLAITTGISLVLEYSVNSYLVQWCSVLAQTLTGGKHGKLTGDIEDIESIIIDVIASITGANRKSLDKNTNLMEAGCSSMTSPILVARIKNHFKSLSLTYRDIFQVDTIDGLVKLVQKRLLKSAIHGNGFDNISG